MSEMMLVGLLITINIILLKCVAFISDQIYELAPKSVFLAGSLFLVLITYIICGLSLGILIPSKRNITIVFYVVGVTILNEFYWPSQKGYFLNSIFFIITAIWIFSWVKLGAKIGNYIGNILGFQILPPDNWTSYVKSVLLIAGAAILNNLFSYLVS